MRPALLFADLADALSAAAARGWRVRGSGYTRLPWRISPTAAPRRDEDARLLEIVARGEHGETVSEVIRAAIRSFLRKLKRAA